MFETQFNNQFENEMDAETKFNGIRITEINNFLEQYQENLEPIFQLNRKHLQTLNLEITPWENCNLILSEGSILHLTDGNGRQLITIVTNIEEFTGQEKTVISMNPIIEATVVQKNLFEEDDIVVEYPEGSNFELTVEQVGTSITKPYNSWNDYSVVQILSDQYLAKILDDNVLQTVFTI